MDKQHIINQTRDFVKNASYGEGSGHDWWHIERVYKLAKFLAEQEGANLFIVEMASLLHDMDDWKFRDLDKTSTIIEDFLCSIGVDEESRTHITMIVETMSFKGGVEDSSQSTIEGMIVQDADRLDAIGAIGIARTFAYGGHKNQPLYNPYIEPYLFHSLEQVKKADNHTINHFYEKLLKLKDLMNTKTAKEIAVRRHQFMQQFLVEFYGEWDFTS